MKKYTLLAVAAFSLAVTTPGMARVTYIEEDQRAPLAVYCSHYVDATVAVNTKGRLVRGQSAPYWAPAPLADNAEWDRVQDPAVYITTKRTTEAGHYTLVPGPC